MHNNGVSHLTAPNDYEGVASIVNWIEYVPKVRGEGGTVVHHVIFYRDVGVVCHAYPVLIQSID